MKEHDMENGGGAMNCDAAALAIPKWVDGEARADGVGRAARLPARLPRVPRAYAEQRNLRAWIVAPEAPAVPEGFAERVARLAAASGARPLSEPTRRPLARPAARAMEPIPFEGGDVDTLVPAPRRERERESGTGSILSFVLACTAVAAAAVLVLSIVLGQQDRPRNEELRAEPLPEILRALDDLNRTQDEAGARK
ncbi:MAG: hypothetical protein R3F34_13290 [Planctomycetota bacterium]